MVLDDKNLKQILLKNNKHTNNAYIVNRNKEENYKEDKCKNKCKDNKKEFNNLGKDLNSLNQINNLNQHM